MRQTQRLDEVRAPRTPSDALAAADVLAIDGQALTLADHYNAVLTQLRRILGTPTWRDAPAGDLAALDMARRNASQALATQGRSIAALSQGLETQGETLSAVQAASQTVQQAQSLVAALQRTVANVAATAATKDELAAVAALAGQITGPLAAALDSLRTRLDALERADAGGSVTPSGLRYVLQRAWALDQRLVGAQDRLNLVFETPAAFYAPSITVFYNGQTLRSGAGGDYVVDNVDSGLSSKTVRLLHTEAAPFATDVLTASYMPF